MKKLTSLLSIFAIVLLMTSVAFAQDEEAQATDFYFEDENGPVLHHLPGDMDRRMAGSGRRERAACAAER